jgi:hypothetical protein
MNKRAIGMGMGITFLLCLTLALVDHPPLGAIDVQLVRIHGQNEGPKKSLMVEPVSVTVPKGGIVVWVNEGAIDEVKVNFEEGKKCADVTSATKDFNLEAACFVTTWIPLTGTTSLKFNEPGTFHYTVETNDGVKVKAKLIVK